jgi:repressor LexA
MNNLGNKQIMAENIQFYLDRFGKTRQQMCDDIGVAYTTVASWMQADTHPRIDKIELMAKYFGVTKADLVEKRSGNADLYDMITSLPEDKAELVRALVEKLRY